jgi:hypothetical protein
VKLQAQNTFACSPERFWEMYWDSTFDDMLNEGSNVQRELLSETVDDSGCVRRLRFTPQQELPSAVASLVGSTKLVYEHESRWEKAASVVHWQVLPVVLADKITAKGTMRVVATPSGCKQVVEGEISVRVRFIGGRIESTIIKEVSKSYNRMGEIGAKWLTEHA